MNENQIYTNGTDGTAVAVGSALATGGGATGGAALG